MNNFKPTLDSHYVDVTKFDNVQIGDKQDLPIYHLSKQPIFQGAYYHKVVSPIDFWIGIEGEVKLGELTNDPERFNLDGLGRFMDNAAVYMGGKGEMEADCGLGYNLCYENADTSKTLDLSSPKIAYRPFWRYIYNVREASLCQTDVKSINSWNNTDPKQLQYYYFPGDIIRMKVYSPLPNYLQLRIELVKPTDILKYVEMRKRFNLVNNLPSDFYSPLFYSAGHSLKPVEFKRVNSIDQYGNEGRPIQMTKAAVSEATWYNCYLYKEKDGDIFKYPFTKELQMIINAPNDSVFSIYNYHSEEGGEKISINPAHFKK